MSKFYLDAGTTWAKILEIKENSKKEYKIFLSSELKNLDLVFEKVTGHNVGQNVKQKNYVNEVVALALGFQNLNKKEGTILDLGSRDIKWVKYKEGKFKDMDWNASCASATGATIEMLLKFYDVKITELIATEEKYAITCGIFGLEKIMDDISRGVEAKIAISKFVHGIAYNAYNFTKRPDKLYVSGGFCENKCFIDCLKFYCEIEPLGRFVLLDGLEKS